MNKISYYKLVKDTKEKLALWKKFKKKALTEFDLSAQKMLWKLIKSYVNGKIKFG